MHLDYEEKALKNLKKGLTPFSICLFFCPFLIFLSFFVNHAGKVQKVFPFADIVSVSRKDGGNFGVLIKFKSTRTLEIPSSLLLCFFFWIDNLSLSLSMLVMRCT